MIKLENANFIEPKFSNKKNITKQAIAVLMTAINICTPMMTYAKTNFSVDTSDNTRFQKFKKVKESFDNFARRGFKEISDFAEKNPKTTGVLTTFGVLSTFCAPILANYIYDCIENSRELSKNAIEEAKRIARDANGIAEHLFGYVREIFSNINDNPEKYYEFYSANTEKSQPKIKLKTKNNFIISFISLAKYYGFNIDEKIFELSNEKQKLDINIIVQQLISTAPNENLKNAIEKVFSREKISSFVQQNDFKKTILVLDKAKKDWEEKKKQFETNLEEYIRKLTSDPTLELINEYNSWVSECKQYDIDNKDLENAYKDALSSENVKKATCDIMYESILSELELIPNKISNNTDNHYTYTKQNDNIVITLKDTSNIFSSMFLKIRPSCGLLRDFNISTELSDLKRFLEPNFTGNIVEFIFNKLIENDNSLKINFNEWKNSKDQELNDLNDRLNQEIDKLQEYFKKKAESKATVEELYGKLNSVIVELGKNIVIYYNKECKLNETGKQQFNEFIEYIKENGFGNIDENTLYNYFYVGNLKITQPGTNKEEVLDSKRVTMLCKYLLANKSMESNLTKMLSSVITGSPAVNLQQLDYAVERMIITTKNNNKKDYSSLNSNPHMYNSDTVPLLPYVVNVNDEKEKYITEIKTLIAKNQKDLIFKQICNCIIERIYYPEQGSIYTFKLWELLNKNSKNKFYSKCIKKFIGLDLKNFKKFDILTLFNKKDLYDTMTETITEGRLLGIISGEKVAHVSGCLSHFFKIALIANKACDCKIDLDIEYDKKSGFKDKLRVDKYNEVLQQAKNELSDILK